MTDTDTMARYERLARELITTCQQSHDTAQTAIVSCNTAVGAVKTYQRLLAEAIDERDALARDVRELKAIWWVLLGLGSVGGMVVGVIGRGWWQ